MASGHTDRLATDVQYLKGVGPKHAMTLRKLGLVTVGDVLWHLPRRYEDRRHLPLVRDLRAGEAATVRGRLRGVTSRPTRGGKVIIKARLADASGEISLVWFNQRHVLTQLQKVQGEIVAFGVVKEGERYQLEMASPEWEAIDEDDDPEEFARLQPVYPLTEGVPQWLVRRAARSAVEHFAQDVPDPLPASLREAQRLPKLAWAMRQIHRPDSPKAQEDARKRLVFDEFFFLQVALQMRRREVKQEVGTSFPISQLAGAPASGANLFSAMEDHHSGDLWEQVHAILPFELTSAQRRVVGEVWADMERPVPMNRLVQGDVGSGKTAVAACAMLAAVRCGYQAALMAPTEILAEQHFINLSRLFEPAGVDIKLLVGKQGSREKKRAMEATANGEAQICVGTHAIIQEHVTFHKLGLAVVDEQHRFGVVQRMALRQKGYGNPDFLVMTATPIPRTLTMTLYGDLDLSVIDELPPGRKPIKTHWRAPNDRPQVYAGVRKLVEEGRQAYFVCPMINESEKMQTQAAEDLFYRLKDSEYPDLRIGLLHGQMKAADKEAVMDQFRRHELDILVATVVIEVGVDVPNASAMVIEDANRFGLAQLHQLRGRVGRGSTQSFCVLVADAKTEDTRKRMEVLVETTNGFVIAEEDLKLRGPGDLAGTRQSGDVEFKIANLVDDGPMLEVARRAAITFLERDPDLSHPEHALLIDRVRERRSDEALIAVS
ncbi:MAG: ATP-dependent DNA helicase RecG [Fimbriimonadaceae bacterium]|nr:ATP-dependent DNA helicase RecG [Fimbriimonadaceae bacterium]